VNDLRYFPSSTSGTKFLFTNNYPISFNVPPNKTLLNPGIVTNWMPETSMTKSYWQLPLDQYGNKNCQCGQCDTKINIPQPQLSKREVGGCNCSGGSGNGCGSGSCGGVNLLDPKFNLREVCKNAILLEDHLFHKEKRCHQCIIKHLLTIEAFLEEAITLDTENKYTDQIEEILTEFKKATKYYVDSKNYIALGQKLRDIRKNLMVQSGLFECGLK